MLIQINHRAKSVQASWKLCWGHFSSNASVKEQQRTRLKSVLRVIAFTTPYHMTKDAWRFLCGFLACSVLRSGASCTPVCVDKRIMT